MNISNCHKAPVTVSHGEEGTNFYVCTECNKACDLNNETESVREEDLFIAKKLLPELWRHYNNEFEKYGQYMTAPPTLNDALYRVTNMLAQSPTVTEEE